MIRGLIFDFDGLIIDTETADYLAWQEIYNSYNIDLNFNAWAKGVGVAHSDSVDLAFHLEQKLNSPLNKENIRNDHHTYALEIIRNQEILPGVKSLIDKGRKMGMKVAIASSSDSTWVKSHLSRLNIMDKFDYISTFDLVKKGKPDPALYFHALKSLGLEPHEAIAFEDSPNGIKAAKAAQLFCIAVANTMTSKMNLSQADIILKTLEGICLEEIINLVIRQNI